MSEPLSEPTVCVAMHEHPSADLADRCDERENVPFPCGHVDPFTDCGGCDPGAIEWVIDDARPGFLRRPEPTDFTAPSVPDPDPVVQAEWQPPRLPPTDWEQALLDQGYPPEHAARRRFQVSGYRLHRARS